MDRFRVATADDLDAIYAFLRLHLPDPFLVWDEAVARPYVGWYIDSSLCGVLDDGRIRAVVMGRPVATAQDGQSRRYGADWTGRVLWVECCASERGMLGVWNGAVEFLRSRGCQCAVVAWCRLGHAGKIRQAPLERVEALLR